MPAARGDFVEHRLQPLLELAAEFRARDQRAHVERHQPLVAQAFRHVAIDDAQRQAFGDGGLADARLADQHRIVLGAARQHLDGAADFLVAADHRIELALRGPVRSGRGHIYVMTSNLGSHLIQDMASKLNYEQMKTAVLEIVGQHFRPEFINRIDDTVVFHPLAKEQIARIAAIQISYLQQRLKQQDIQLEINHEALTHVAQAGFIRFMAQDH